METSRLEIITYEHRLPEEILKHYGVPAKLIAQSAFFSIFALETHETNDEDSGVDLMQRLLEEKHIVEYAWSRPVNIPSMTGTEFKAHLEKLLKENPCKK